MKLNQNLRSSIIKSFKLSLFVSLVLLSLIPNELSAKQIENNENENQLSTQSNKMINLSPDEIENLSHLNELINSNTHLYSNNERLKSLEQDLTYEQRASLKSVIPYLLELYLEEQLKNQNLENYMHRSSYGQEDLEDNTATIGSNEGDEADEEDLSPEKVSKRGRSNILMIKKESPAEKRTRDLRRQQAARWDIGFGKRGSSLKSKSFMDALYGKRSSLKHINPKLSFGRKQQWDIQYGRR